jgi:UDP-glucose 4-epimerase
MVTFAEAILDGEPMEIHGDGLQTRTFTYVTDTVDAFVRALEMPMSRGEIVNVGATTPISMIELAERIQTMLGVPLPLRATFVPYESLPGKYQDVRHRVPDITKAKALLGFEAKVGLDDGLRETLAWHQDGRIDLDAGQAVGP